MFGGNVGKENQHVKCRRRCRDNSLASLPCSTLGFDHGVGHSLLLLYDAKASYSQKSKYFNVLGHYPFKTLYKFILN